jgi:putative adhesin
MKRPIIIALLVSALVLVLAGIGAVIFFTANGGFPTNNPFDRRNISSELEESKTLKVDTTKPLTLKVADAAGDVTITGADVDTVQVKVVKTAYDSSQSRADAEVEGIKYIIEQAGNTITLKYELPKSMNFSNNVNTVDFVVTVPREVTVDVNGNLGKVSVAGTKGNVDIKNDFGDATIENIEGALSVQTNSGEVNATSIVAGSENIDLRSDFGTVILKKAGGKDITLDSNSGTITLSEVRATGDLTTNTGFGNIAFENGSADALHVETNSGKVSLVKINITKEIFVKDDFGDIELEQAIAPSYDLHTNSGSVTVNGAGGKLKADTDFGNVTISNAQSVTLTVETKSGNVEFSGTLGMGPHFIKSDFGGIDISLPTDAKLTVDLKTDFGKISSDIPITVTLTESSSSDKSQIIGSINGGGEQLTVQANSGNINIKVRSK